MMASNGVVYMQLASQEPDRLVGVSVNPSIAGAAEIHETVTMGEGADSEIGGQMTMRPVGTIALPPGEDVLLEPGGFHIMLLDLASPLSVGDVFDLTLSFEAAAELVVEVEVRENAP
jgi:copper(I)-binding protein